MGRSSRFHAFRDSVVYGGLWLVATVARSMPLSAARATGRRLGALAYRILPRDRRKARRHLAIAFPERSEDERRTIARQSFTHLGESLFEIGWLPRLHSGNFAGTTRIEGLENMRRAVDAGRGVVLFTGHCGNWEWMAASIALAGFSMKVIARELQEERIHDFIVQTRRRFGVETICRGSTAAAREILSTLRGGAILGVLIDQNIRAETALISFLGRPAPTPVGPAQIAIRVGAMVIAGFIERRDGMHYLHFDEPRATTRSEDPVALTAEMTRRIEEQIRRVPEQWVWMHDRWRIRGSRSDRSETPVSAETGSSG